MFVIVSIHSRNHHPKLEQLHKAKLSWYADFWKNSRISGSSICNISCRIRATLTEVMWWMAESVCSCSLLRSAHTTCWKTLVIHCWVPAQASSARDRWFMFQSLSISQAQEHIHREALYKCSIYKEVWLYKHLHYYWTTTEPVFILKSTWNRIQNLFP